MNQEILFKTNTLIRSQVSISSNEYKIFNKILYKCQIEFENNTYMIAELSKDELRELVKVQNDSTPKALLETLERFMKIIIRFEKESAYVSTTLINKVEVDKITGNFRCLIDRDLYDVLMGYKEIGFSPIDLKLVRNVNGFYTQRFYELFRIWSGTKQEITYSIDELKKMLLINTGTSYDLYANFKRKVVNIALKEINQKLNMEVCYSEKKNGRKVVALEFKVIDHEPRKYNFDKNKIIEPKDITMLETTVAKVDDIDSIDYVNLIDLKLNESIHEMFLNDFHNYKDHLGAVKTASDRTLNTIGGKTINKRNYRYFKTSLENLLPSEEFR